MATILRSPAEPKGVLRTVGDVSSLPEQFGADWIIVTEHGLVGVQRKEVRDLVASIRGDRIARELGQSSALHQMVLIVEGDWQWDTRTPGIPSRRCDGMLKAQYDGFCLSIQHAGWWVLTSASMADTARMIGQIGSWFEKGRHDTLRTRPKSRALWGTYSNRDWACHWWQAIDGIGVTQAYALFDAVGVPVGWTVTEEELLAVPGIGPGRAKKILAALPTLDSHPILDTVEMGVCDGS